MWQLEFDSPTDESALAAIAASGISSPAGPLPVPSRSGRLGFAVTGGDNHRIAPMWMTKLRDHLVRNGHRTYLTWARAA